MPMTNFTLLYVEDDTDAQEKMKMMLEDSVKELYQAHDGAEGFSIFMEKKPDVILTDINMPILNGLSMVEKIKDVDSTVPVIVMSAFDNRESLLRAINIGVDYFIPKPIDMDILEDRLRIFSQNLQNKLDLEEMRKKEKDELFSLAYYDTLTKIPNRLFFNIKLEQALSRAKRVNGSVTLFFIDLDDFKKINDTYGHSAGDKVLESISSNIKKVIRIEDIFFRISGDEFSIIIEDSSEIDYIDVLSKKILSAASTPIHFNGNNINISCSIGISSFPKDASTKDELIHLADIAMYKAKKSGKSNYVFYEK
jgi:diguanylate cyclase (GGDEF)-like protein